MRLLDRYVLREFTTYLGLALLGFIAIFLVVDIFEKIDVFLDHQAPLWLVGRFYLYRAPEVVVQVFPVALLLATFLALGQFNKFGELTAMRVTGLSLIRILLPVFAVGALSVVVALLLSELVIPRANRERDSIYDLQIRQIQRQPVNERADVTFLGRGGRIFYMRLYLVREQRMHEVSLQEFSGGELKRRIDAAEATWDGTRWVFVSGFVREFGASGERARPFQRMAVDGIREVPDDFSKEVRQPDEMNFLELASYVDKLRTSGARVANHLVDLHLKLAFPLVNLVLVVIGASLATRLRMQSAAMSFGLSVAISFLYYAFMRTGQALGHSGALTPYLAAWMGDLAFGIVAVVMLFMAQRR